MQKRKAALKAKVGQIPALAKVAGMKDSFTDARASLREEAKRGPVHLLGAGLRGIRAVIATFWRRLVTTARSESTLLAVMYAVVQTW